MELRILKLDVYVNNRDDEPVRFMIQKPGYKLCVQIEELCDAYDIIQITYVNSNYDMYRVKNILKNQNYCYYHRNYHYSGTYNGISYDECYINNVFKNNIIFIRDKDRDIAADGQYYILSDFMDCCIRDKLPCLVKCKYSDLLSRYKITETNVHELYYVEQLGKLTKAAIKKLE